MTLTLSAKNKLGFVNGSIVEAEKNAAKYKLWERCNDLEIWDDIEQWFGYASMTQIYSLEQHMLEINQGQDSISEFFTKMKTIWDGINNDNPLPVCTCNLANILMMCPMPNVSQAYRLFAQEKRHKEISNFSTLTEAMAFYSDRRRFGDQKFVNNGYTSKNQSNPVTRPYGTFNDMKNHSGMKAKPYYFCSHCKIPGHSYERCFKVHGFPPGFKPKQNSRVAAFSYGNQEDENQTEHSLDKSSDKSTISMEQYQQFLAIMGNQQSVVCLTFHSSSNWLIDSGAIDHICPHLDRFQKLKQVTTNDNYITIPDGSQAPSLNRPPILLGSMINGLYSTKRRVVGSLENQIQLCTAAKLNNMDQAKLWHLRLGHLPFAQLPSIAPVKSIKECAE
ncbi:uncharacterized protein LOC141666030 [Apium graveolens]|uniref:uncharacterized protein LOC141666030 n=1 Tax=Apium graveolens TaxID=4045 RepID=UPI003D7B31DD